MVAEKDAEIERLHAELQGHRASGRELAFGSSSTAACDGFVPNVHVITEELYNEATQFSNESAFWPAWRAGMNAASARITYKNFGDLFVPPEDAATDVNAYVEQITQSCAEADALVVAIPFGRTPGAGRRRPRSRG